MTLQEWKEKTNSKRRYVHFDKRTNLDKSWEYITNPKAVAKHAFYPFIHYTLMIKKYNGKEIKIKERELCYSAHLDRCIYQYYGFLLNEKYNEYVEKQGFSDSTIAYRNNQGKSNIYYAKQAFDFIKKHHCHIIVGDFTHFFDELDHIYLKRQICEVLGLKNLSDDFYAVYKNITRFSKWDLSDILKINNLSESEENIKTLNEKEVALTKEQFIVNKSRCIKPNKNNFGIPQGSAISAVLSNVYMIKLDKILREYVDSFGGLYLRYSDDFIVVIPRKDDVSFTVQLTDIQEEINKIPRLILQPDKTQVYCYKNNKLLNESSRYIPSVGTHKDVLDYLGFTFDGQKVRLRDKTISKYYYRLYRKIKTIVNAGGYTRFDNQISYKNLYMKYSNKGSNVGNGNFISYVNRVQKIFKNEKEIGQIAKVHYQKIRNRLKKGGL